MWIENIHKFPWKRMTEYFNDRWVKEAFFQDSYFMGCLLCSKGARAEPSQAADSGQESAVSRTKTTFIVPLLILKLLTVLHLKWRLKDYAQLRAIDLSWLRGRWRGQLWLHGMTQSRGSFVEAQLWRITLSPTWAEIEAVGGKIVCEVCGDTQTQPPRHSLSLSSSLSLSPSPLYRYLHVHTYQGTHTSFTSISNGHIMCGWIVM